jgi:hypothetical protein
MIGIIYPTSPKEERSFCGTTLRSRPARLIIPPLFISISGCEDTGLLNCIGANTVQAVRKKIIAATGSNK